MIRMHGYIGHYVGAPDCWFFVLASSPEDAMEHADEWGQPDARSLKRVDEPIAFQFKARLAEDDKDSWVEYEPDEPPVSLGSGDAVDDWIKERLTLPFGDPAGEDFQALDATLGKKMSKEWRRAVNEPSGRRGDSSGVKR